jgi:ribose transport system permease protein
MSTTAPTINPAPVASRPEKNRQRNAHLLRQFSPLALLLILLALVFVAQPSFFSGNGVQVLAVQSVPVLLLALGQMTVMMVGAIDLASAAAAVLAAVVVAESLSSVGTVAPLLTLVVSAATGALSGFISAYFQVPSFAVTLGALGVWQAAALLLSGASTVYVSVNAEAITWLLEYQFAGFRLSVWVSVALAILLWLTLKYTTFGRNIKAIGLNEKAAILAGVPTVRTKTLAFALSGAFAGMAGICLTAQQGTATASGLGIGLLLPAIAAAVAGGVAITGGVGNPVNVIIGALIVSLITIGSAAVGIDPRVQQIIYGIIVILAVTATIDRTRLPHIK